MAHAHAAQERRGGDAPRRDRQADNAKEREAGGGAHYLKDVRSSTSQMRRPSDGSSLSWRWAALNFSDPRRHCPCLVNVLERSADYSKAHWTYFRSLKAEHSIVAMLDVLKCKKPGCTRQRCVLCVYKQHGTDCCDCEMFNWLLNCHRRGKDQGGSRQNGGGGGDNQPGTSGRDGREHHRGNGAATGRGGGRGTPSGGGVRRGDPLGRPADAAVLRGAAAALNEFSSDGSFLERFKGSAEAAAAGARAEPSPNSPLSA
jgi:hypothetical protein